MFEKGISKVLDGKKGVFFDMDGVLYDSMGAHADAWSNAFRHFGIDFPPELVYQNEGRTAQSTINMVFQQNEDRQATASEIEQIYSKKTELIEVYPDAIPFEGAMEFMESLNKRGLDIWVVTGSSQDKFLEPLLRDFSRFVSADKLITGRDVRHGKPHPEPYLKALSKSGWKPSEVVVIENAPLGIQSAKGAGIYTVAINTGILEDAVLLESGADLLFRDWNGLKIDL
jgi:HAD superfamily hydrolase (TIGR01509 family)